MAQSLNETAVRALTTGDQGFAKPRSVKKVNTNTGPLIVLDLNRVLGNKDLGKGHVFPNAGQFVLQLIAAGYRVGIWSSTTFSHGSPIVEQLLKDAELPLSMLEFVWYRNEVLLQASNGFETFKPLIVLWANPILVDWSDGAAVSKFGPHNTILIDDEPDKLLANRPINCLGVPYIESDSTVSLEPDYNLLLNRIAQRVTQLPAQEILTLKPEMFRY